VIDEDPHQPFALLNRLEGEAPGKLLISETMQHLLERLRIRAEKGESVRVYDEQAPVVNSHSDPFTRRENHASAEGSAQAVGSDRRV
jgi:hypothetical protein